MNNEKALNWLYNNHPDFIWDMVDCAYPIESSACAPQFGLTKREYFAAMALQGLIASFTEKAAIGSWGTEIPETVKAAVEYADALLLELAK